MEAPRLEMIPLRGPTWTGLYLLLYVDADALPQMYGGETMDPVGDACSSYRVASPFVSIFEDHDDHSP